MNRPLLCCFALGILSLPCQAVENLTPRLDAARKEFGLPAVAAVLVKNGKVVAEGVSGTRVLGGTVPATLDDRFHLGSDTKAFTALLAAMLVEEGKLRWDLTLAEAFPELKDQIPEAQRKATLQQVLSHSSGLPGDSEPMFHLYLDSVKEMKPAPMLRMWLIEQGMKLPMAGKPGEQFVYSNFGYTLAGSIIERAAGKSWEELIHERIFTPLGLKTAGLGPQCSLGVADAAVPHLTDDHGKIFPMLGGNCADVPTVMGPSGNAHMSPHDFATWAAWNVGEGKRGPKLVSAETLKKLHTAVIKTPPGMSEDPGTPKMGDYALGWGIITFPWSKEKFLMHGGSNAMNLAWVVGRPEDDTVLVLTTNIGGAKADLAFRALTQAFLEEPKPKPKK